MRVFAEYFELTDQRFRRKTLLQFGDSTKLLGTVILMNPGSAEPIGNADVDILTKFYQENHQEELIHLDIWKEFKPDSAMYTIEKLFNGYFVEKNIELNGVIQLFNCSYVKNQHLDKARERFNEYKEYQFNEFQYLKNNPVYFGWGKEGVNGSLKDIAKIIFEKYDLSLTPMYSEDFYKNKFTYPPVVQKLRKRYESVRLQAEKFFNVFEKSLLD